MRELVDIDYPDAPIIRVVMDNLSTHSAGAIMTASRTRGAPDLKRLEFHHTPKHASWLNMVEIEIGVLRSQCLDRRIDDKDIIVSEIAAWEKRRNAKKPRSNGCSQPKKLAKNSAKPIQSKSHNHCAAVLAGSMPRGSTTGHPAVLTTGAFYGQVKMLLTAMGWYSNSRPSKFWIAPIRIVSFNAQNAAALSGLSRRRTLRQYFRSITKCNQTFEYRFEAVWS